MKKLAVLLTALVLVLSFPAGQARAGGGTLTVGVPSLSGCFDPFAATSAGDRYVVELLYDTLIRPDGRGGYLPAAARRWDVSEDGRTITFHLARGLLFSDGTALTARDVVHTYRVAAAPGSQGPWAESLASLLGYEAFHAGLTEDFPGVVALNERTVLFRFTRNDRVNLADCLLPILPDHGGDNIGSGPYVLSGCAPGVRATLLRSPTYRGGGYAIQRVVLQAAAPPELAADLLSGRIDLLPALEDPLLLRAALNRPNLTANQYAAGALGLLAFNCQSGATADPAVRRALAMAVDRESFLDACGGLLPAPSLLPPESWAADELLAGALSPLPYDPARAAALLDEAGWRLNSRGQRVKNGVALSVTVLCAADQPRTQALVALLRRDWEAGLGIRLTIEEVTEEALSWRLIDRSDQYAGSWEAALVHCGLRDGDPQRLYPLLSAAQVGSCLGNVCRYRSPEADRLLEKGRAITDPLEARPVYRELAALLSRDVPMVPVYAPARYDLYTKALTGLRTGAWTDWTAALRTARLERQG